MRQIVSTLVPYTTLFRSGLALERDRQDARRLVHHQQHLVLVDDIDIADRTGPRFAARAAGTIHPHTHGITSCEAPARDRKSTRLNSSHLVISYAVFCLKT